MTDAAHQPFGRALVLGFVAVLVVASFSVGVAASQHAVTLNETATGPEITVASDGQTVFINATNGSEIGGTETVPVENATGSISVDINDDGTGDDPTANDGFYTGSFTITSGSSDGGTDTLNVADGSDATVTFDSGTATVTADYTPPGLESAKTAGTDGNGDVDEINVTFNESVNDSTVAAEDFTLSDGGSVDSFSTGDTPDDENVTLFVSGLSGTNATPDVTLAAGGVEDEAGNSIGSGSTVTSTDGTAPIQIVNRYNDADGDGTVDTLNVTFSEPIVGSNFDDTDWTITNAGDPNLQSLSNVRQGDTPSKVRIDVTADENVTGRQTSGVDKPEVKYEGPSINDSAGNSAQTQDKSYSDAADPVVKSIEYLDTDDDGTVDRIDVTFTEYIDSDQSTATTDDFTLSGTDSGSVTIDSLSYPDTTAVQVNVTGPADNTGLALELAYSDNKIEDAQSNPAKQFTGTTVDDGAAPIVSSFSLSADDANEELDVSFDATESLSTISVSITGPESDTLTSFSESGSTYSASLSASTSGDYTATLDTADDSAGNSFSGSFSDTATLTISTPTPTSTPTATPESSSRSRGSASQLSGISSRVRLSGTTGLSEVGVSFSGARAGTVRATEVTSLSPPSPPGLFVSAVDITVPDSLTETPSTLKFAVSRERLDELGVSPGDLTVYRLDNGEWSALETRIVDRGSNTIVVEADTPGFSRFAVMAESEDSQSTPATTTAEPDTESSDADSDTESDGDTSDGDASDANDTPMETAEPTGTETETPGFGVGVALVSLVVALLVGRTRRD